MASNPAYELYPDDVPKAKLKSTTIKPGLASSTRIKGLTSNKQKVPTQKILYPDD